MKVRDEAAAKAKDAAVKAGKTPEEAETIGLLGGLEAENAFLAGEVQTGIAERTALKATIKDAEPFVAKGKAATDAEKTAGEKLTELQGEIAKRDTALLSERRDSRLRGALAQLGVRADRMDAAVRLADTAALTYDEKSGAFVGLNDVAGVVVKGYPEFVGEQKTGSLGNDHAGRGKTARMKLSDFNARSPADRDKFIKDGGTVED